MHDAVPLSALPRTTTFEMPSPRCATDRRYQTYALRLGSIVSDIRLRMRDGSPPTLRNICLVFRQDERFAASVSQALGRLASTLLSDRRSSRLELIRPSLKWAASIYFLWDTLRLALPGPKWYSRGPLARPGFLINCMETNLPAPPRSRLGRTALRRASSSVSRQDWRVPFDDAVHLPDTWVRDEALRRGFGNVVLGDCHRATAEERAFRGRVAQARRRGQCLPGTERVDPLPPDPDDDLALGGADPHLDSPPSGFLRLLDHPASFGVVDDDESARWPSGSQREPLFLPSPTPDILASASPLRSTLTPLRSPTPSRSLSPLDLQMVPASEPDMPAWSPTHDATASVAAPSSLSSPSPDSASPCLVSRARSPLSSSRPSPSPSDSPTPSGLAHPPMEASPIYSSEPSSSPGAGQLPEYPQRPLVDSIRAQTLAYSPTPTRRWVTSPVCGASLGRASPVYGPASSSRCRPSSPWREWVPPTNGHDPTSSPPCEEVLRYPPSPPAGAGAEMTYASMSPPPSCGEFLQYPPSPPAETEAEMTYDLLPPPPVCRAAPHHLARLAVETDLEDAYTFLSFTGARHSQGPLSVRSSSNLTSEIVSERVADEV